MKLSRRSNAPFMFPPNSKNIPPAPVLKVGDRVRVREKAQLGVGTVISFDYRLVKVSFSGGLLGWWARMDLVRGVK